MRCKGNVEIQGRQNVGLIWKWVGQVIGYKIELDGKC